jgi:hypothetical protein
VSLLPALEAMSIQFDSLQSFTAWRIFDLNHHLRREILLLFVGVEVVVDSLEVLLFLLHEAVLEVSLWAGSGGTREWIMVCSLISLSSFS